MDSVEALSVPANQPAAVDPRIAPEPTEAGRTRADPRLPAYLVAGLGAIIAAIATGRHELAALGAPFIALAAMGLVDRQPACLRAAVSLDSERMVEGDVVDGRVRVAWEGIAEVDVMLSDLDGVTPIDPSPVVGWSLPAGQGPVELPFRLRARDWGIHSPGRLWVRLRRPGGLLVWEQKMPAGPTLQVLPSQLRLDRLLKPAEPRTVAGMHLSRFRGHGTDFAELRPYRPGDRMRDLSWATSARLGTPWVAVHHPERTGTVLLLLDAFSSTDRTNIEALARAARAAWAVASVHLQAQDRVGLIARGGTSTWLAPRGGRRARLMLLDQLLAAGGSAHEASEPGSRAGRALVSTDALVVGVTGLRWPWFIRDLVHYRRSGHTTVALVIDTSDLLPDPDNVVDDAARRIWLAQRDSERQSLERAGIPTALVTASAGVGPAISTLRRRMSAQQSARGGARSR
jgi:uncharacterized protein (DUF58 family)